MINDMVGTIKCWYYLVMYLGFERFCFVRLDPEKHLITFLKTPFLNDVGLPVASCDFGPCGGYPLEPLGQLFDLATMYQ
jgi:hypothetical protein